MKKRLLGPRAEPAFVAMQTPSAERAEAPDAFESQSDATVNDVHDHVPLSALADIADTKP